MLKSNIVGITAIAKSGKDTFCNLLSKIVTKDNINVKRFALADWVKIELQPFIKEKFNIDIFNCTSEQKEIIRPIMVSYACSMRDLTKGRHWIERIGKDIRDYNVLHENDIIVITDVRFKEYPKDENYWIHNELNGILVHIKKYIFDGEKKIYFEPPNEKERENDPKLWNCANYTIEWPHILKSKDGNLNELKPYVEKFYEWLKIPWETCKNE